MTVDQLLIGVSIMAGTFALGYVLGTIDRGRKTL